MNWLEKKNPVQRKQLINQLKECVINAISEIAKNVLYGKIPLTDEDYNKLSSFQNILRKISKPISIKRRRNIIVQNGGILDTLIPANIEINLFNCEKFI